MLAKKPWNGLRILIRYGEWAVRVWRDVRYHPPKKVKPDPLALAKLIPDGEGIIKEET